MTKTNKKLSKGRQFLGVATLALGLAGVFMPQSAHATALVNQHVQISHIVHAQNFFCNGYWSEYPCPPFIPSYGGYPWYPPHYPWYPPHYPWYPPHYPWYGDFHGGPGGPGDFHGGPGGPGDFHGGPGGFPGGPGDSH